MVFTWFLYPDEIGIQGNVGFSIGGKPEYPEDNPRSNLTKNQQQTQATYDTRPE